MVTLFHWLKSNYVDVHIFMTIDIFWRLLYKRWENHLMTPNFSKQLRLSARAVTIIRLMRSVGRFTPVTKEALSFNQVWYWWKGIYSPLLIGVTETHVSDTTINVTIDHLHIFYFDSKIVHFTGFIFTLRLTKLK